MTKKIIAHLEGVGEDDNGAGPEEMVAAPEGAEENWAPTRYEQLRCRAWQQAEEDVDPELYVHSGYVEAQAHNGVCILLEIEDDFERWALIHDPVTDGAGNPISDPTLPDDCRTRVKLMLPKAKLLIARLTEAVAALEIDEELLERFDRWEREKRNAA